MNTASIVCRTLQQMAPGQCVWVLRVDVHTYRVGAGWRVITPLTDRVVECIHQAAALVVEQAELLCAEDGDTTSAGAWFDANHGVSFHANATGFPTMELAWRL
jgi:hypothetical protein